LYTGSNANGQVVYTWVANRTLTTFDMDLAPLLGFLWYNGMLPVDVYLGTVQFGTETFSAVNPVNFSVRSFEARIKTASDNTDTSPGSGGVPVATQLAHPTSSASRNGVFLERGVLAFICGLAATTTMLWL
jgi:hypothetical protein